jgi:hypothetical protein
MAEGYSLTPDLIVVIPGITGSALRRGERVVWDLSVAAVAHGLSHTTTVLAGMQLPDGLGDAEPDPVHRLDPVGLIEGWHVWPGFWSGVGYGRLLSRLHRLYPEPGRVVAFAYDWRLSNRVNARRLQTTVDTKLARWQQQSGHGEAKVIYICHSMGGLIARYYLEVLGGRETCRRLITIGTPYSGSVKAIKALTGGLVRLLPRLDERLVNLARTLPAVHQLLPTYHCIVAGSEPITLSDATVPNVPTAAICDAHSLHTQISEALSRNGRPPYERYAFGGRRQPTDQSVSITPSGLRYNRHQRDIDHTGDGTVPLFSSVAPEDQTTAAGIFYAARHSRLQRHDLLLEQIIDKVNGVDLGATLSPPYELALDLPDMAQAGIDLPLTVTADFPDLLLRANIQDRNGALLGNNLPLSPNGHGTYTTTVQLPPGAWQVEVETVAVIPPAQVSDLLVVSSPEPTDDQ